MAGIVPEAIRLRVNKSHWGGQFQHGFLVRDRARIETIVRDPGALGRYVDGTNLSAAFSRCTGGQGSDQDGMNLWLAVTLGWWLRGIAA